MTFRNSFIATYYYFLLLLVTIIIIIIIYTALNACECVNKSTTKQRRYEQLTCILNS